MHSCHSQDDFVLFWHKRKLLRPSVGPILQQPLPLLFRLSSHTFWAEVLTYDVQEITNLPTLEKFFLGHVILQREFTGWHFRLQKFNLLPWKVNCLINLFITQNICRCKFILFRENVIFFKHLQWTAAFFQNSRHSFEHHAKLNVRIYSIDVTYPNFKSPKFFYS